MANAVVAVMKSHQQEPVMWTASTMDEILQDGDNLYTDIVRQNTTVTYLKLEDIPQEINNVSIHISDPLCGAVGKISSDDPFYCLEDAVSALTENADLAGLIFTMGRLMHFSKRFK